MMSEDDEKVIDDLGPEQAVPREKVMFESSTSQKEFDEEEFPDTSFDVVDEEENETNKKDVITTEEEQVSKQANKDFFVSFENLTVHVPGRRKGCCASEHNPLWNFARENLNIATEDRDPLYALNDVSGYLKAGEMCLVLGSEDLPVTTLLRTLCGRLNKTDDVSGTIFLNGIPLGQHSTNQQGWRRLSPYVSETDASHSPVLTVKETFEFAAQCTNGATSQDDNVDELVQRMLQILDLSHVQDTVVGDENLRGISGGQKRRVTVGEMMFDLQSKFFCLEHITDGLASTDSKTLIQNLSHYCHAKGVCGFISLLQPSDDIVETFDKLCVLTNDGGLAYYGPTERYMLRSIFLEPTQRNTIVDSGSIADLVLRNTCDSLGSQNVQERFYKSELGTVLTNTLLDYRSKTPPASQRGTALEEYLPSKKYNTSRWYQAQIIAKRRLKLIQRNAVTYMRIGVAIFFGIVIGSLFSALGPNIMGALGRTGYMFLNAFLVLMLSSAVTIPASFRERVTLFKHRRAELFSGRIAYVTQIVLDAPLSILEAILLAAIGYYWVGMNPRVANFFFFMGCLIGLEFVGQAFGRLLCSLIQKEVSANAASSVCILIFATVGGFMPSFTQIPTIFKWLSWVTPVSYAFEAMMINEFHGTTVDVFSMGDASDGSSSLIETSGDNWLKGFGIPRTSWTATVTGNKIFNIFMLFFFAALYDALGAYYIEYNREYYDQPLRRPQRKIVPKKKKNTKKQEEELIEEGEADVTTGTTGKKLPSCLKSSSSSPLSSSNGPQTLAIHNICYDVPLKKEKVSSSDDSDENEKGQNVFKRITNRLFSNKTPNDHQRFENEKSPKTIRLLNNVNAVFERGHMVALMGSSGAGKTTLLDVIAGYKTGGSISGDIMVDGVLQTNVPWKQMTGYAEQNDILNPFLSVRETIRFTAVCKLPRSTSSKELNDAINRVVELVSLEPWLDMIVGHEREGEGLPKHARKRLTIALQLVVQPKILFLDEPTSGLGTIDSKLVMDAIRRSTDELGLITIATIHQPSQRIWDSFDDVLLLAKGGKLAYFGPRGTMGSNIVLDYFETMYQTQQKKMLQSSITSVEKKNSNDNNDEEAQENELNRQTCNPADFVIQALTSIDATQVEEEFQGSELYQNLMMKLNSITSTSNNNEEQQQDDEEKITKKGTKLQDSKKNSKKEQQTTVNNKPLTEFWLLTKRQFIVQWRNPSYCFMRLLSSCVLSLYMGILFVGNKSTLEGAVFSIGSIFFLVFVLVIPMQASVVPLVEDRAVLYRETVSGTYSRLSYGLGQLVADIPFHIVNALIMFVCFYFIAGFRRNVGEGHMGYFLLMIIMANWVIMSVGQLYSLVTPNEESANGLAGLTVMLSVILMGFLITVDSMPSGWTWAYWCNLFRYILQGLVTNELGGNTYHIDIGGMLFGNDNTNATSRRFLEEGMTNQTIVAVKGNDQVDQGIVTQITNLMGLVGGSHKGEEDEEGDAFAGSEDDSTSISRLSDWLQCNIQNECFVDPIMTNVMDCNVFQLFGTPPCKEQFNAAQQDLTQVSTCFIKYGDFSGTTTGTTDDGNLSDALGSARNEDGIANGVPSDFTLEAFQQLSNQTQVQLVVCLIDALVPQDTVKTLQRVTIKLFDIVGVVIDVINNGIDLPGDLILWFFGWATVDSTTGDIVAPFKWWYCMGSVAIFLIAIEVFKLIAIRFIVWTKR